jgi:hypothetical protein
MISAATKCGEKEKTRATLKPPGSEPIVNTTAVNFEDQVEDHTDESQQAAALESLTELSTIELAYVGGGTGSVCFL